MTVRKLSASQPASPMDLVHPERLHSLQFAMGQAPFHKPFHRPVHRFPTYLQHLRRFPPAQSSRPARQESHHGAGHRTLPVTPRNVFDNDSMLGAFHSPWRIVKPGGDSPQRHKAPAPLWQAIIAGCRFLALRAAPADPTVRLKPDLNPVRFPLPAIQAHLLVNETHKTLYSIQNGLNL